MGCCTQGAARSREGATRLGDELARQRRELPRVRLEKEYRFETDDGAGTLAELFDGRSQLLVYHFMFGPSYEAGCPTCSSIADTVDGALPHLHARDVTMLYVSQAPLEKLRAHKQRMGCDMPWVSSAGTDFNFGLGYSRTEEQTRDAIAPMLEAGVPAVVEHNAESSGTDAVGYFTEGPAWSRVPYGLLRNPRSNAERARHEGGESQVWIRRHEEY